MVVHTCNICKREFGKKSAYNDHINRKNPCKEKVEEIGENDQKSDDEDELEEILKNPAKTLKENEIIEVDPAKLKCMHCNKTFTRSDNLKVHVDSRCKIKKEKVKNDNILLQKILELEEKNKQFEEENKLIKQKINILETTKTNKKSKTAAQIINNNNINNINITNNIVNNVANFGSIDHKKIDDKVFFNSLIKHSGLKALIKFIEYVHKNDKFPEYKNVKITDLGRNLGQIVDNKQWLVEDANEITDKVIDETYNYYEVKFEELDDEINEKTYGEKLKIKRNKRFIFTMRGSQMFVMNDDGDYVDDDGVKVSENDFKNGKKFEDKFKKQVKMLLKM